MRLTYVYIKLIPRPSMYLFYMSLVGTEWNTVMYPCYLTVIFVANIYKRGPRSNCRCAPNLFYLVALVYMYLAILDNHWYGIIIRFHMESFIAVFPINLNSLQIIECNNSRFKGTSYMKYCTLPGCQSLPWDILPMDYNRLDHTRSVSWHGHPIHHTLTLALCMTLIKSELHRNSNGHDVMKSYLVFECLNVITSCFLFMSCIGNTGKCGIPISRSLDVAQRPPW